MFALTQGARHIEKHVCLNRKTSQYDFQSALEPKKCIELIKLIKELESIIGNKFISKNELNYLNSTIEKPVAAKNFYNGDILNLDDMNIRGSQVWLGYKDHCGEDIEKFVQCAKNRDESMVEAINANSEEVAVRHGASFTR